jgi:RHS repeat-associated protein
MFAVKNPLTFYKTENKERSCYVFGLRMEGICSKAAGTLENKYQFGGKERQAKEFSDGSGLDSYDFGARNYDPQIGRWFNHDKFAEVYVALTPYQYAANNPIKIIDEAGHLLKDKDGNIIATSTGKTYSRSSSVTVDGNKYQTTSTYKEVVVYTDQGTPVRALQQVASYVEQVNADGSTTKVNNAPVDCSQNCHGNTFADGKLVIVDQSNNNESVNVILKEDGYVKVETPEAADIFVQQGGSDIVHTGKVNKDGSVTSDHGDEKPQKTTIQGEKDRQDPDVKMTGYKRNGTDKQVSTKAGKVSNGVRTVSQQQATDIRKKNGLKTTNKVKGQLPSNYELE